jgi:hypothetical protein
LHDGSAALAGVDGPEGVGRVHRQEAIRSPQAYETRGTAPAKPVGQNCPVEQAGVDRRLMMGGEDTLAEAAPGITPEQIRESVRRAREEDRKPYVPRRNVPPHYPGSITERVRRELRKTKDFDLKNYKSIFDK